MHHIALVLFLLWFLVYFGWSSPVVFFGALLYLYAVNERHTVRLRRKLQFEERKYASQRRLLSDSESVRWLNHAVEKVWPICMEQIASQQFLLPVIPWFLDKYKPWTARKAVVQHLYLGRNPPMFTEIRVLNESADDDHLVLELGMNFLSADDMSAILEVQLRKRLGFGIWAKMHITGMHLEGKVLVGVKFLRHWPFLGRVRVCFTEPPYFQMTVKPIINHGLDVTELPGIAGWLDKLLAVAFEQTLVEPNMLVVDVEKFASDPKEGWFTVDEKAPIAYVKVEVMEGADMKPSDMNGLADPYVKGQCGPYRFQTKIHRKTLTPRWFEEFKIPICSWEGSNSLEIQVLDKDHIFDDTLGDCSININELRGGQRHDKWLTLRNIKMGRLHLAITVLEGEDDKVKEDPGVSDDISNMPDMTAPTSTPKAENQSSYLTEGKPLPDEFEPVNIEGQEKTGIWVHHPGSDVAQTWEPRKGRSRHSDMKLHRESDECTESPRSTTSNKTDDEISDEDGKHVRRIKNLGRGLRKFGSLVHRSVKSESTRKEGEEAIPPRQPNIRAVGQKEKTVKLVVDDSSIRNRGEYKAANGSFSPEKGEPESPRVRDRAKNMIKQSAHSLKNVLSRKGDKRDGSSEAVDRESYSVSDVVDEHDPFFVGGSQIVPPSEQSKNNNNAADAAGDGGERYIRNPSFKNSTNLGL